MALIARRARVPIVPTSVIGAYRCWPRGRPLPALHPIIVAYGRPLGVEQVMARGNRACMTIVRDRIIEMMRRFSRHSLFDGGAATSRGSMRSR